MKKADCLPPINFTVAFHLVVLTVLLLYYSIFKQNKFQKTIVISFKIAVSFSGAIVITHPWRQK
jgi:hypothetical protein